MSRALAHAGIGVSLLLAVLVLAAPSAQAAPRDGVCESGEFCLYYNSGLQGSLSDFDGSIPSYGTTQPACYEFRGPGDGRLACVKNNAASAWNRAAVPVTVYYNSGYEGSAQVIAPGARVNLSATLKNENASHRFGAPSTGGPSGETPPPPPPPPPPPAPETKRYPMRASVIVHETASTRGRPKGKVWNGEMVRVLCQQYGSRVNGTPLWDYIEYMVDGTTDVKRGYVTDYFVGTGSIARLPGVAFGECAARIDGRSPGRPAGPGRVNPHTAQGLCGSRYTATVATHDLDGKAVVSLLAIPGTDWKCVVTLKTTKLGERSDTEAWFVQGLRSRVDRGRYRYYAGPQRFRGDCVLYAGGHDGVKWTSTSIGCRRLTQPTQDREPPGMPAPALPGQKIDVGMIGPEAIWQRRWAKDDCVCERNDAKPRLLYPHPVDVNPDERFQAYTAGDMKAEIPEWLRGPKATRWAIEIRSKSTVWIGVAKAWVFQLCTNRDRNGRPQAHHRYRIFVPAQFAVKTFRESWFGPLPVFNPKPSQWRLVDGVPTPPVPWIARQTP